MSLRPILLAIVCAVGCSGARRTGPFVRQVTVSGHDLVLERCWVVTRGENVSTGECWVERRPLPVTAAALPPALEPAAVVAGITPSVRASIAACGRRLSISGQITARVTVHYSGSIVKADVIPDHGMPLANCIGEVLATVHYPITQLGTHVDLTLELP